VVPHRDHLKFQAKAYGQREQLAPRLNTPFQNAWPAQRRLCDIPFGTLYGLFARWTRLGLWRRLLDRLRRTWRLACADAPGAVVIDSRSCRSAPWRKLLDAIPTKAVAICATAR
jgi:hypothetical protein